MGLAATTVATSCTLRWTWAFPAQVTVAAVTGNEVNAAREGVDVGHADPPGGLHRLVDEASLSSDSRRRGQCRRRRRPLPLRGVPQPPKIKGIILQRRGWLRAKVRHQRRAGCFEQAFERLAAGIWLDTPRCHMRVDFEKASHQRSTVGTMILFLKRRRLYDQRRRRPFETP